MHPLAGIWAKLDRGDKHVQAYARAEQRLMGRKKPPSVAVRQDFDRESSRWVVKIGRVDELPPRLGVLMADAVHNYRSALDQLVFELAFMDTDGDEIETTMFPGSLTPENWESVYVQTKLLSGLTQTHKTRLKRFQPCNGWNGPDPHPIALLLDLSNDDKHRLTQPALVSAAGVQCQVRFDSFVDCVLRDGFQMATYDIVGRPFEMDTPIFALDIVPTGQNPKMDVKCQAEIFVGFRNGTPSRYVEEIGRYARSIVEALAPEFERPKALKQRSLPRFGRIRPRTDTPERILQGGIIDLGGAPITLVKETFPAAP